MKNTVAATILNQLGGNKFAAMTGAKNFTISADSLRFALPSTFATGGINIVTVTLNSLDTYDVSFLKLRGIKCATIAEESGVYADQLRSVFTNVTGLEVGL